MPGPRRDFAAARSTSASTLVRRHRPHHARRELGAAPVVLHREGERPRPEFHAPPASPTLGCRSGGPSSPATPDKDLTRCSARCQTARVPDPATNRGTRPAGGGASDASTGLHASVFGGLRLVVDGREVPPGHPTAPARCTPAVRRRLPGQCSPHRRHPPGRRQRHGQRPDQPRPRSGHPTAPLARPCRHRSLPRWLRSVPHGYLLAPDSFDLSRYTELAQRMCPARAHPSRQSSGVCRPGDGDVARPLG